MCRDCEYLTIDTQRCTCAGVPHSGEKRKLTDTPCQMFMPKDMVIGPGTGNMIVINRETMTGMEENTRKMGQYLLQLGQLVVTMQKRMDAMEARQRQVTVSHGDVKRIQQLIRMRTEQICEKNGLGDPESRKVFRAAIKRDVLKRWGVKDLHDLPDAALPAVESAIGSWVNIRLVMERRAGA
jgi:hypothetical protein